MNRIDVRAPVVGEWYHALVARLFQKAPDRALDNALRHLNAEVEPGAARRQAPRS